MSSTKYRTLQPKNHPIKWALDARHTGNECPSLGLSMPITCSLSARVMGTQGTANACWLSYQSHFLLYS